MNIIDPGHYYALSILDGYPECRQEHLRFVKRQGPGYPGNVGQHPGTNIQEVLRVLIHRVKYLHDQIPSSHNITVLGALRKALTELEIRAAERHGRAWHHPKYPIELAPCCPKCGHIGCGGKCH